MNEIRISGSIQRRLVETFSKGVVESTVHLRKLISINRLYYHGFLVTRQMAARRRRRCIKLVKDALKGIIR